MPLCSESHGRAPGRLVVAVSIALLCAIWGSTWLVIRGGLEDLPPFTGAATRFLAAGTLMALIAPRLARLEGGNPPSLGLTAAMGVLNIGISYALVYWSETKLPSGLVSLLWALFPILMSLTGHLFLPGERLRARQGYGIALGFLGVGLLFATDLTALGPSAVPAGALLLLSPVVCVIGTFVVKRHGGGTSSVLLNRNGMLLGGALLALLAFGTERDSEVRWTAGAIGSVAYLTLVGSVIAFGLYFWLLRYAPAYQMSLINYIVPVIALALGALVGDEPVTGYTVAGAGLVLGGVALVLGGRRPAPSTASATPSTESAAPEH